ncbi:MAG: sigma-70 family RNA polymerase sigma factor [Oscillospiraceae bacterium]|nr:sigma-70 family RNA polymerase sigma factor [Oscillospiraceae bacterium]
MKKTRIESLVNRSQSGDLQAMEELLEAAHTSVSYQCRKMMAHQEDAEDLTQEVLLAVYQKIDTLKEAKAFWSWLHRITATHCMNALSRNHVDLQFAEDEDGHSVVDDLEVLDERSIPGKALDNAETARMIDAIVSDLPEAQRMSTLLYYYNEMSVKEIAQIMNVPENTVKSRLNLARKAIKDKVLDYEKQGVKLYSASILPFLWYFLRTAAECQADTGAAAACASGVITTTKVATTTAATTGAMVTGAVTTGIAAKIVAGCLALAIAVGGAALYFGGQNSNSNTVETTTATSISQPVTNSIEGTTEPAATETETATTEPTQASKPSTELTDPGYDDADDPVWKYNHPTLTEVRDTRYAHWRSITVYDRMAICTGYIGSTIPILSMGNTIGELGFNEKVLCTGEYDNGWFRVEYKGATGYVDTDGHFHTLHAEPVIFTYTDGTTGTVPKHNATYIDDDGEKRTYIASLDGSRREDGEICFLCGKEVKANFGDWAHRIYERLKYCHHSNSGIYCIYCGKKVPAGTCHDCIEYFDESRYYCEYCGKDGSYSDTVSCCYAADYLGYKVGNTVEYGERILEYLGNDEWKDEGGIIWNSYEEFGKIYFYRLSTNGTSGN